MADIDKYSYTEPILQRYDEAVGEKSFWGNDGNPSLDYDLLCDLLEEPVQNSAGTQDGRYAAAVEMWVAEEFRRACFEAEAVWPRRSRPRVISPDIARLIGTNEGGVQSEGGHRILEFAGRSDAKVWGSAYVKQVDAGIASSWVSGPEALVSIKTQSSSFGKNVNNRIEESYGDGQNLKKRFPLACTGYMLVLRDTILTRELRAFQRYVHVLQRFVRDENAYDTVALLCVHWDTNRRVSIDSQAQKYIPPELSAEHFFKHIIETVLERAPLSYHTEARSLRFGPVVQEERLELT